jgi:hypothetical protein
MRKYKNLGGKPGADLCSSFFVIFILCRLVFTCNCIWIRCMYCVGLVHLWMVCSSSQDKVLAMYRVVENVQCTISYLHSIYSAMLCPSPTHNTETKRIWMFVLCISHWANYKTRIATLFPSKMFCIVRRIKNSRKN